MGRNDAKKAHRIENHPFPKNETPDQEKESGQTEQSKKHKLSQSRDRTPSKSMHKPHTKLSFIVKRSWRSPISKSEKQQIQSQRFMFWLAHPSGTTYVS